MRYNVQVILSATAVDRKASFIDIRFRYQLSCAVSSLAPVVRCTFATILCYCTLMAHVVIYNPSKLDVIICVTDWHLRGYVLIDKYHGSLDVGCVRNIGHTNTHMEMRQAPPLILIYVYQINHQSVAEVFAKLDIVHQSLCSCTKYLDDDIRPIECSLSYQ